MKHISEILGLRKTQLEKERAHLYRLHQKGSGEWAAFNAIRDDHAEGYRVRTPRKPIVMTEPRHVLRIIYPYPRSAQ